MNMIDYKQRNSFALFRIYVPLIRRKNQVIIKNRDDLDDIEGELLI